MSAGDVAGHITADEQPSPRSYAPETILTVEQVADWLQLSVRTVEKMGVRSFTVGNRRRYLAAHILDWINKGAA